MFYNKAHLSAAVSASTKNKIKKKFKCNEIAYIFFEYKRYKKFLEFGICCT